jgi:hypothetical protein
MKNVVFKLMVLISMVVVNTGINAKTPKIQMGPDAEISFDGLHKVDRTVMDDVWVKPDLDLAQYNKIYLSDITVSFKDVDDKSSRLYNRMNRSNDYTISNKNKEKISKEIKSALKKQLAKLKGFESADKAGDDVLSIEAFVIDIVSHVPPLDYRKTDIYLRSAGEATLILEFRDSISNEILIRAIDQRDAEQPGGTLKKATPITNITEFRKLANDWGRILRKRLEEISELN